METVARTWNGPDWLVDISKYLLSAPVLLPVSSSSYGLNLASIPFKALSFLKSFQAFRDTPSKDQNRSRISNRAY